MSSRKLYRLYFHNGESLVFGDWRTPGDLHEALARSDELHLTGEVVSNDEEVDKGPIRTVRTNLIAAIYLPPEDQFADGTIPCPELSEVEAKDVDGMVIIPQPWIRDQISLF